MRRKNKGLNEGLIDARRILCANAKSDLLAQLGLELSLSEEAEKFRSAIETLDSAAKQRLIDHIETTYYLQTKSGPKLPGAAFPAIAHIAAEAALIAGLVLLHTVTTAG